MQSAVKAHSSVYSIFARFVGVFIPEDAVGLECGIS